MSGGELVDEAVELAVEHGQERDRALMIARNRPARTALLRDPQATLRTLPLVTSFLDESARRPSGDRLRNAFASVWEVSHMELRLSLVAEGTFKHPSPSVAKISHPTEFGFDRMEQMFRLS